MSNFKIWLLGVCLSIAQISAAACDDPAGPEVDWRGCNKSGENLVNADLTGSDLRNIKLEDANLQGANLNRAKLDNAKLKDADLQGANLSQSTMLGAKIRGADLSGANISNSDISRADFSDSILNNADLSNCVAIGTIFEGTSLRNTDFSGCNLQKSKFKRHDDEGANYENSNRRNSTVNGVTCSEDSPLGECVPKPPEPLIQPWMKETFIWVLDNVILPTLEEMGNQEDFGRSDYYGEEDNEWVNDCRGMIKGSRSGKYHQPGTQYYDQTTDVVEWFCTVEEAEAAGYAAPR